MSESSGEKKEKKKKKKERESEGIERETRVDSASLFAWKSNFFAGRTVNNAGNFFPKIYGERRIVQDYGGGGSATRKEEETRRKDEREEGNRME